MILGRKWLGALVAALVVTSTLYGANAADKTATQLLPRSVAAYAEIAQPPRVIDGVLDHPLTRRIEQHPDYQKYLESPQYQKFLEVAKVVEDKLGMKLRGAITTLAAEGIYVGGDLATQGIVLLVRSSDEKLTEKARDTLLELARAEATSKGKPDPVQVDEHMGIAIYQLGEVRLATHGKWYIASNKPILMRAVLTNCVEDNISCLADESQFQAAHKARPEGAAAWGYVDLRLVRATGILKAALRNKSDNPGIELIAGGILGALPDAPYVTGTIFLASEKVGLEFSMPTNVAAAAKQREFYFGAEGKGQAPPVLHPKETLLTLSTYRDFASMWRNAPDLFNEQVNAQFAEAEAGLSTFFSGRNFRDDILGNLEPGLQLVVARQRYGDVVPAMKIPAGAIVMRMKNPERTARDFKITFQSAIGFLNVVGGMNGLSPFDVNSEKQGDMLIVAAEYLPPADEAARKAASPQYNASPTIVFVGDKFILSSTKALALELAELLRKGPLAESDPINTQLEVDLQAIRDSLADNTEPLIAQNMLEKGHDRPAAEKEIKGLLDALGQVRDTRLRLSADEKALSVQWEVRFEE